MKVRPARDSTAATNGMDERNICSAPRDTALQGVQLKAEARAAKSVGARYVNVVSWFCSDVCSPVIGDTGVYRNQFHTTAAFGRLVSGPVGRALDWPTTA